MAIYCILIVLLVIMLCKNHLTESYVAGPNGTFSSVMFYEGEGYLVALKDTTDSLPIASRFFKAPALGSGLYQVARTLNRTDNYSQHNSPLITFVGNNFIAAPIRMRGGDRLDDTTISNMKNIIGKKIKGTWEYVGTENRDAPTSIFIPNKSWNKYMEEYPYKMLEGSLGYSNISLSPFSENGQGV